MSTYTVSPEGVSALNKAAEDINSAIEDLPSESDKLAGEVQDYSGRIGPHESSITNVLESIGQTIKKGADSAGNVAAVLKDVADTYQEIIDEDLYSGLGN